MDLPEGKIRYKDERLLKIAEKFSPQKVSPFFVEFVRGDFLGSDCLVIFKGKILDILILDLDKIEIRLTNLKEEKEKQILEKCIGAIEQEIPLCDLNLNQEEKLFLNELGLLSLKPTLVLENKTVEVNMLIEAIFKKSEMIFFYTGGKKEVKSWLVKKGNNALNCAGKIHSDFARGFIKAEIVNFNEFSGVRSMPDAKAKDLVKVVGKDYIVQDGDILNVRFNV